MVGARLGAYEITAPLGAGGMGEVYRARDTNLNREVAIKVLPAEVAGDPDRLARFEREAKLLAAPGPAPQRPVSVGPGWMSSTSRPVSTTATPPTSTYL